MEEVSLRGRRNIRSARPISTTQYKLFAIAVNIKCQDTPILDQQAAHLSEPTSKPRAVGLAFVVHSPSIGIRLSMRRMRERLRLPLNTHKQPIFFWLSCDKLDFPLVPTIL